MSQGTSDALECAVYSLINRQRNEAQRRAVALAALKAAQQQAAQFTKPDARASVVSVRPSGEQECNV